MLSASSRCRWVRGIMGLVVEIDDLAWMLEANMWEADLGVHTGKYIVAILFLRFFNHRSGPSIRTKCALVNTMNIFLSQELHNPSRKIRQSSTVGTFCVTINCMLPRGVCANI